MNKTAKILVTIGLTFLFIILFAAIGGAASDSGKTPGILGLIVLGGYIGGLRAIWKNGKKSNDNDNSSILQK